MLETRIALSTDMYTHAITTRDTTMASPLSGPPGPENRTPSPVTALLSGQPGPSRPLAWGPPLRADHSKRHAAHGSDSGDDNIVATCDDAKRRFESLCDEMTEVDNNRDNHADEFTVYLRRMSELVGPGAPSLWRRDDEPDTVTLQGHPCQCVFCSDPPGVFDRIRPPHPPLPREPSSTAGLREWQRAVDEAVVFVATLRCDSVAHSARIAERLTALHAAIRTDGRIARIPPAPRVCKDADCTICGRQYVSSSWPQPPPRPAAVAAAAASRVAAARYDRDEDSPVFGSAPSSWPPPPPRPAAAAAASSAAAARYDRDDGDSPVFGSPPKRPRGAGV